MTAADVDLIVIGGGPAGSNAAAAALRGGLTVTQFERRPFPRAKTCAGGLTVKAWQAAEYDLAPTFRRLHRNVEVTLWGRQINRYTLPQPILAVVDRREMDARLVEMNRRQPGFSFFDGEPVVRATHAGVFIVKTARRTLTARQLICADGAARSISRHFAVCTPADYALAVEILLPRSVGDTLTTGAPVFDIGAVAAGYGWIFPKDDHCSAGIYSLSRPLRRPAEKLLSYLRSRGITSPRNPTRSIRGGLIPVGGRLTNIPEIPLYITGDAGGLADALTGEGIYNALASGRLAGETAAKVHRQSASPSAYYDRLRRTVLPDTHLTYRLCRVFYRNQTPFFHLFERSFVWRTVMTAAVSGATYRYGFSRCLPYFFRSLRSGSSRTRLPWPEGGSVPLTRPTDFSRKGEISHEELAEKNAPE